MFQGLDEVVRKSQTWLEQRGKSLVGSGCFRCGPLFGSLHTDLGPPTGDKSSTNQDFALAWVPADASGHLRLVLALADGLSSSFRSEKAAELACWVALRSLVQESPVRQSRDLAQSAFNAAGLAISRITTGLIADPSRSHPKDEIRFRSTWKYILENGRLLETTLLLAWLDQNCFYMAMVGDGGGVWRELRVSGNSDDFLAKCDPSTHDVNALGPHCPSVTEFDCWCQQDISQPFYCALYTDGIGRGVNSCPSDLLDELQRFQATDVGNPAEEYIKHVIDQAPQAFPDNLTISIVGADHSLGPWGSLPCQ